MKVYLESRETVPLGIEPEFIRADVTGRTEVEQSAIQTDIEAIMVGRSYSLVKHFCRHDDGGACTSELIKET